MPDSIAHISRCATRSSLTLMVSVTNFPRWQSWEVTMTKELMMAKAKRQREERLQIMLGAAELVLVDDFRFKKRMPSRAAAVRELLKRGLAAEGFDLAAVGAKS